jgi:hypothetical protein
MLAECFRIVSAIVVVVWGIVDLVRAVRTEAAGAT